MKPPLQRSQLLEASTEAIFINLSPTTGLSFKMFET